MIRETVAQVFRSREFPIVVSLLVCTLAISTNCRRSSAILSPTSSFGIETLPEFAQADVQPVYSSNPKDAWNRIFNLLFTRKLKVRLATDFAEGAPFKVLRDEGVAERSEVSSRVFDRFEDGDRAIDPLYPTFFSSAGALQILTEPNYAELVQALTDSLNESGQRESTARALMQSDAWAAYDVLYRAQQDRDTTEFRARKDQLLRLLARLIRKIALSGDEIKLLPQNGVVAGRQHQLPKFYEPSSGWIEIEFLPQRLHDDAVNFRREARVFVKPIVNPVDKSQFVQSLRESTVHGAQTFQPAENLEAVALVLENLLIDSQGEIVASPLIQDVQIRKFVRDANGKLARSELREYELSRRKLLTVPSSSGFIEFDENSSTFASVVGNDYGFATPFPLGAIPANPPLVVKLRSRCASCHGTNQTFLMSLAAHEFFVGRMNPVPHVRTLNVEQDEHASYVIARKMSRADFKSLRGYAEWASPR